VRERIGLPYARAVRLRQVLLVTRDLVTLPAPDAVGMAARWAHVLGAPVAQDGRTVRLALRATWPRLHDGSL